jgi:hypothetical protein
MHHVISNSNKILATKEVGRMWTATSTASATTRACEIQSPPVVTQLLGVFRLFSENNSPPTTLHRVESALKQRQPAIMSDPDSLTNCRFYEEKYPEIESFVMVNVKQVCDIPVVVATCTFLTLAA